MLLIRRTRNKVLTAEISGSKRGRFIADDGGLLYISLPRLEAAQRKAVNHAISAV